MSEVRAVAFAFTRPDAVVYIGKGWTDTKDRRYRLHVYPPMEENAKLKMAKDRPNVVLLRRADKASALNEYASKLHRVIFLGSTDELTPLGVPILDVVADDKGKLISAPPRANVEYYNRRIEDDATPFDLAPRIKEKPSHKKKKVKVKKKLPRTLGGFLDAIEPTIKEDGDEWQDLELPVLRFFLEDMDKEEFAESCKKLALLGAGKRLCRAYYRWVAIKEPGLLLSAAFSVVAQSLEDGITIDVSSLSEKSGVNPKDLSMLYNMYQSVLKEKE